MVLEDWLLPVSLERVRRKLKASEDGDRQMVKILAVVLSDGLAPAEAACREALNQGVHSADVIINKLARTPVAALLRFPPVSLRLNKNLRLHRIRLCRLSGHDEHPDVDADDVSYPNQVIERWNDAADLERCVRGAC